MNYFDNEMNILEYFKLVLDKQVFFITNSQESIDLYCSLHDDTRDVEWINSSKKSDPPPDFYNPSRKLMMDIMRVDDHGHFDDKGKYINPVNQKESKIQSDIRKTGILDSFPTIQSITVTAVTDLPEKEDHNYNYYYNNFKNIVKNISTKFLCTRIIIQCIKRCFLYLMNQ